MVIATWLFVVAEVTAVARRKGRSVRFMASGVIILIAVEEFLQSLFGKVKVIASE